MVFIANSIRALFIYLTDPFRIPRTYSSSLAMWRRLHWDVPGFIRRLFRLQYTLDRTFLDAKLLWRIRLTKRSQRCVVCIANVIVWPGLLCSQNTMLYVSPSFKQSQANIIHYRL